MLDELPNPLLVELTKAVDNGNPLHIRRLLSSIMARDNVILNDEAVKILERMR